MSFFISIRHHYDHPIASEILGVFNHKNNAILNVLQKAFEVIDEPYYYPNNRFRYYKDDKYIDDWQYDTGLDEVFYVEEWIPNSNKVNEWNFLFDPWMKYKIINEKLPNDDVKQLFQDWKDNISNNVIPDLLLQTFNTENTPDCGGFTETYEEWKQKYKI